MKIQMLGNRLLNLAIISGLAVIFLAATMPAQEKAPPVRVNLLNVCSPSADEQKEISAALTRIPRNPHWGEDFEVARGRSSLAQGSELSSALAAPPSGRGSQTEPASLPIARWTRIRREFPADSPFSNAQYSFSVDAENMVETLVFRLRQPKDLLEIALEDSMSSVTPPAAALAMDTPASRIKLERFGKASIVLARCGAKNPAGPSQTVAQSAFEPLFRSASTLLSVYRNALNARRTVPAELARVGMLVARSARAKTKSH